jgi:YegS/Rv2252/BmrU family lipid kinase
MMTVVPNRAPHFFFIVNPHAGRGSVGRQWPHILDRARQSLGPIHFNLTKGPGDAVLFTREALLGGADVIVCVGGDGTLNEVVTGMMDEVGPIRSEALLGLIPNGTGCDFIRTVRIPRNPVDAMDVIAARACRPLDLGRLSYTDNQGRPAVRHFHNVTSFGLGGEVDERVNRTTKALGGFFSFFWATLLTVLRYRGKSVVFKIDGSPEQTATVMNLVIGNGQYHGGGMWVAPEASVSDGLFHLTIIGDFTLPEIFRHLPKLYNGKLLHLKKVRALTARKLEARSEERVLLDVDGEQPGVLPATAEIVPAALRLIVPKT